MDLSAVGREIDFLCPGEKVQSTGSATFFSQKSEFNCIWVYYRPQTKFAKVLFLQVSVCPRGGGVRGSGDMHTRVCVAGGCVVGAVCGMHAPPQQILRDTVIRSMSGRYASYWNAFLFVFLFNIYLFEVI